MTVIAPRDDAMLAHDDVPAASIDVQSESSHLPPPDAPVIDQPGSPDRFEKTVTALVVAICAGFTFWQLQPDLIFSDTTPTGGDMGCPRLGSSVPTR